jgi:hypothetical protein
MTLEEELFKGLDSIVRPTGIWRAAAARGILWFFSGMSQFPIEIECALRPVGGDTILRNTGNPQSVLACYCFTAQTKTGG